jgi:ABC-type antimicrobial peptide transport system permease subunit
VLALVMASIGVYGVISFATSQRTKELGIRVALGADRETIVRMIMSRGVRLVLYGLIPGVALAIAASKGLQSVMPEIERQDPWIFIGTSVALGLIGAVAALIPAFRAARVDPLKALRME